MALVADYNVVEALTAKRTDVRILPRRSRRAGNLGDSHRIDLLAEVLAIRGLAIAQQLAWIPRDRFGYLTR
jgi:hypothetical protein